MVRPVRRHWRRASRLITTIGACRPHRASSRWAAPECQASPIPSVSTKMSRRSRRPREVRPSAARAAASGPVSRNASGPLSPVSVSSRCVRIIPKAPTAPRQSMNRSVVGRLSAARRPSSTTTSRSSHRSGTGRVWGSQRPSSAARIAVASSSSSTSPRRDSTARLKGRSACSRRRRSVRGRTPANGSLRTGKRRRGGAACPFIPARCGAGSCGPSPRDVPRADAGGVPAAPGMVACSAPGEESRETPSGPAPSGGSARSAAEAAPFADRRCSAWGARAAAGSPSRPAARAAAFICAASQMASETWCQRGGPAGASGRPAPRAAGSPVRSLTQAPLPTAAR
ncbi:hypothetical protein BJY14_000929 [Actinomadura luteofluorescens]|uniref:Uncharacterized protein n=1 Tax=Actinomadura luteofluorescens TaxID=46163 RepID=A0A7Y9JE07_9ACTN|nr:hypothetical protein [Actinomadura luteofluorescens]